LRDLANVGRGVHDNPTGTVRRDGHARLRPLVHARNAMPAPHGSDDGCNDRKPPPAADPMILKRTPTPALRLA
jgi:hypothetical protein